MTDGIRTMEIMRELGMSLGQPMIAIVGCGGAGCNVVNSVYWNCTGVHTVAVNTDSERLEKVSAHRKIQLGSFTEGKGCGMPEIGERCAEESSMQLREAIEGYDLIFIVAGLGGGTGSGAAPVVARISREEGAIVFSVPILPFSIEGNRRSIAMIALEQLQEISNFVIPLDNDKLHNVCGKLNCRAAFEIIDKSVMRLIQKIYEHSSSYVSDLIDEVTSGFVPIEDVVASEHDAILEEMPAALHTSLEPNLEFPIDPYYDPYWSDGNLPFN